MEEKIKDIQKIIEMVMEANLKGKKFIVRISKTELRIHDANNGYKGLLDDFFPCALYLDEEWDGNYKETLKELKMKIRGDWNGRE